MRGAVVLLATLRCEHRWHKAWWLVPCLSQETLLVLQASHKRGQENNIQATILDRRTNDQASFKSQGTEFLRLPFAPLRFPTKDIACLSSLRETSSKDWSGTDERLRLSVAVRCDTKGCAEDADCRLSGMQAKGHRLRLCPGCGTFLLAPAIFQADVESNSPVQRLWDELCKISSNSRRQFCMANTQRKFTLGIRIGFMRISDCVAPGRNTPTPRAKLQTGASSTSAWSTKRIA